MLYALGLMSDYSYMLCETSLASIATRRLATFYNAVLVAVISRDSSSADRRTVIFIMLWTFAERLVLQERRALRSRTHVPW